MSSITRRQLLSCCQEIGKTLPELFAICLFILPSTCRDLGKAHTSPAGKPGFGKQHVAALGKKSPTLGERFLQGSS
jgi:hypothetical protein